MNESVASGRTARFAGFALVAGIIALVAALVGPTIDVHDRQPIADQSYYLHYMRTVSDGGLGALPGLFEEWLGNQDNWIFPPPSRVAFVVASALWAKLFGATFLALIWMSLAAHLALIAVNYAFARRHLGEWRALLLAALTAFSPLYLGLSRMALIDNFISLWQQAALWLFFELIREPGRRAWRIAFVCVFTVAILSKEISVLLEAAFVAFALIERFHRRRPLPLMKIAWALALPPLITGAAWVLAAGGVSVLARTLKIVLASPAANYYAINFGSGPWYRYVVDELLISPCTTLLALACIAVVVARWRNGQYDSLLVYLALLCVVQLAVLSPFTKNLRYVAVLEVPLRALAVVWLCSRLSWPRVRLAHAAQAAIVAALCIADFRVYDLFFVVSDRYDPITVKLLNLREIAPPSNAAARAKNVRPKKARDVGDDDPKNEQR